MSHLRRNYVDFSGYLDSQLKILWEILAELKLFQVFSFTIPLELSKLKIQVSSEVLFDLSLIDVY